MVKCVHDEEIARDVLEYCGLDASGAERRMASLVMLKSPQARMIIRTSRRPHATGDEVWIHPKTVNAPRKDDAVEISDATEWQLFRYRFRHDRRRRIALGGFVLAVIGALVDGALLLGDKGIGIATAAWWIDTLRVLALVAKVIGLAVVFFEGLLKE